MSWLLDDRTKRGVDQFVVRQGDMTEVFWHDTKLEKPEIVEGAARPVCMKG